MCCQSDQLLLPLTFHSSPFRVMRCSDAQQKTPQKWCSVLLNCWPRVSHSNTVVLQAIGKLSSNNLAYLVTWRSSMAAHPEPTSLLYHPPVLFPKCQGLRVSLNEAGQLGSRCSAHCADLLGRYPHHRRNWKDTHDSIIKSSWRLHVTVTYNQCPVGSSC